MVNTRPLLIALPLDHETPDIVATAAELGRRLAAPIVVVHAIPRRQLENARGMNKRISTARSQLEPHLTAIRDAGVEIQDVLVAIGHPAEVVITSAARLAAQMIVTGGGRPATIRRWVVGSVAEAIVRESSVPVWVARGQPPAGRPLLCPVDLSPESKIGLAVAIRMARLFQLPLALVAVVSEESTQGELDNDQATARAQVEGLLAGCDVEGLDVSVNVTTGDPADQIVGAADDAGLLVIASRGYDPLVHEWLGPVTTRVLRHSLCSALTIRHVGEGHEERVRAITRLADLHQRAKQLLADDRGEEALVMLESLAEQAPVNAAIQEAYAIALERVGRSVEATSRHELAALVRDRIG
ncbi:putative universal stress protein [Enhygromyxa salina]|uniref:Putative universal stress protein n=1 Tax=Enhygromyxa salina TaxID=215803 RepID=A0A2S9XEJ7_9BACT|nr:universal stress protein [Enhygromyxa salina]PRP91180.1 putative universal stress protein [Enhygromyxa salina]